MSRDTGFCLVIGGVLIGQQVNLFCSISNFLLLNLDVSFVVQVEAKVNIRYTGERTVRSRECLVMKTVFVGTNG